MLTPHLVPHREFSWLGQYLGQAGQGGAGGTVPVIRLLRSALFLLHLKDELSQVLLLKPGPFPQSTLMDRIHRSVADPPSRPGPTPGPASRTSHVDTEPRQLLGPPDVFLGWSVVVVGQTEVGALQVELDCQIPLLRQPCLAFDH